MIGRRVAGGLVGLLGAAAITVMLAGCASGRVSGGTGGRSGTGSSHDINGAWQLVSGSDETGTITPGNAMVTFTFNGQSSGGHGPCNSFGATATGTTTGPVSIRVGIHTEMACVESELNTTETRYFAALDKVTTADLRAGTLVLSGAGDTLNFTRAQK